MPLRYPLIPMALFRNIRFVALAGVASVATMFYYSLTVIWPQMITALYTTDNIQIGLMSGTVGGAIAFGQVIGGTTVRYGYGQWQLRASAILMCAFIGAMASCDASTKTSAIIFSVLGSFAVGIVEVVAIIAVPFAVPPADLGLASGVLGSCRSTLGSVALAIFSSVLASRKAAELPAHLSAVATADGLSQSSITTLINSALTLTATTLLKIPGITSANVAKYTQAIQDGNVASYHTVFLSSLAFGGFAVICAFLTKSFNEHFTEKVERRLQGVGKPETKEAAP